MVSQTVDEILKNLAHHSTISHHSTSRMVGAVDSAAKKEDARRKEKQSDPLRRKPELQPLPGWGEQSVGRTPWDVLHALARATALTRRGAARGLAEHWGALKYSQALTDDATALMTLSDEGKVIAEHYKILQSKELGIGFALVAAHRYLTRQYPDRMVSIAPADIVLSAGWRARRQYRPQYFAELWKPGKPSLVLPIACTGNHSNAAYSYGQLATSSAHVEAVHIGQYDETPALVISTALPKDGPATVHALQATGTGGWLCGSHAQSISLDDPHTDENFYPDIQQPTEDGKPLSSVTGFHVTPERYGWFRRVLARTSAAGLTAFAGDSSATYQYLSENQGRKHFTGFAHAAAGTVQDAAETILGLDFLGTDHVFRLNRVRVEAFSGVAKDLLQLLSRGRVEQYRQIVYERRFGWSSSSWDDSWKGPVSVHPDGTVLAMRLLT